MSSSGFYPDGWRIESSAPPSLNGALTQLNLAAVSGHQRRSRWEEITSSVLPDLRHMGRWWPAPPMWLEGRMYIEWLRLIRDPVFRGIDVPPGLGRPILLVPGFLAGDW